MQFSKFAFMVNQVLLFAKDFQKVLLLKHTKREQLVALAAVRQTLRMP